MNPKLTITVDAKNRALSVASGMITVGAKIDVEISGLPADIPPWGASDAFSGPSVRFRLVDECGRDLARYPLAEGDGWKPSGGVLSSLTPVEFDTDRLRRAFRGVAFDDTLPFGVIVDSAVDAAQYAVGRVKVRQWAAASTEDPTVLPDWRETLAKLRDDLSDVEAKKSAAEAAKTAAVEAADSAADSAASSLANATSAADSASNAAANASSAYSSASASATSATSAASAKSAAESAKAAAEAARDRAEAASGDFDGRLKDYAKKEEVKSDLASKADKTDLEGFATIEDLLAFYYPDGNVTSMSQITTNGIEYAVGEDGGAYVAKGDGLSGHVVLPWKVTIEGNEYKVTAIGGSAFSDKSFTGLTAPTTVKIIRNGAFNSCSSLASINLPSVTSILVGAFNSCTSLTSINLPSVTSIGAGAFIYCSSLALVDFGSSPKSAVPSLSESSFEGVPTSCKFIIPIGMYADWISASGWSDLYARGYKFEGYASMAQVANKADKATTLAGYGITDAATKTELEAKADKSTPSASAALLADNAVAVVDGSAGGETAVSFKAPSGNALRYCELMLTGVASDGAATLVLPAGTYQFADGADSVPKGNSHFCFAEYARGKWLVTRQSTTEKAVEEAGA